MLLSVVSQIKNGYVIVSVGSQSFCPVYHPQKCVTDRLFLFSIQFEQMTGAKIIGGTLGACVLAFALDYVISDKKIFGGNTPSTVSNKEWWEETDKKFQAWPRTAGPPVVMNPISRQNFIVKSRVDS
ncbi:hypothetical protein OSB04_020572 [Centaurea solstitialis]|uniref:Uncharacterized protein n=1 Tax=Centaurea solstitialis TaxID=347529 RepID=A0AA38WFD3_9ASTR|nr:hypothetical protein OSB04_020572 [Centaurea solstitialis]